MSSINVKGVKRKYIPKGALIAGDGSMQWSEKVKKNVKVFDITAFAVPTKHEGKYLQFIIGDDRIAKRDPKAIDEKTFLKQNQNVSRLNTKATIEQSGNISVDRLRRGSTVIKDDESIDVTGVKRKYIPKGVLIAEDGSMQWSEELKKNVKVAGHITAFAVPTKHEGKYIQFIVGDDRIAKRDPKAIDEKTFLKQNQNVSRTNTKATIEQDGNISVDKLRRGSTVIKDEDDEKDDKEDDEKDDKEDDEKDDKEDDDEKEEKEEEKPKKKPQDDIKDDPVDDRESDEEIKEVPPPPEDGPIDDELKLDVEEMVDTEDEVEEMMETEDIPEKETEKVEESIKDIVPVHSEIPVDDTELKNSDELSKLLLVAAGEKDRTKRNELIAIIEYIKKQQTQVNNTPPSVEQPDMPVGVAEVEDHDMEMEERETEQIKENTIDTLKQAKKDLNSAANKLSAGVVATNTGADNETGAHIDVEMEEAVDTVSADAVLEKKQEEAELTNPSSIVDIDNENASTNKSDPALLGAGKEVSQLDQTNSGVHSISTSANAMAAFSFSKMDVDKMTPEEKLFEKQRAKAFKTKERREEKDAASALTGSNMEIQKLSPEEKAFVRKRRAQSKAKQKQADKDASIAAGVEGQMDTSALTQEEQNAVLLEEFNIKTGEHKREAAEAKARDIAEAAAKAQLLGILESGGTTEGFEKIMENMEELDVLGGPEHIPSRKFAWQELLEINQMKDIQTDGAPTREEHIHELLGEVKLPPSMRGQSGVGTSIFAPGDSRNKLSELQAPVSSITNQDKDEIQAELTPLWDEFKKARMYKGIQEMERMPSRLIKNPKSSVQNASKIREDETEQNVAFGNFMYWLVHDRLDSSSIQTWDDFLFYSAALGYNRLTKAQVNWIVTDNENGDLTINTNFHSLSPERDGLPDAPPLFHQLPLKTRSKHAITPEMVKSLDAQVKGASPPRTPYPSRNTSPSAAPVDNSIHPDGSTGPDRTNRNTFSGVPTSVFNIPDPRVSIRGGAEVPNVRIAIVRNPKFGTGPTDPEAEGYQKEHVPIEVPDIGAGSKDIGAHIDASVADRLLRSMPTKLYAPIHAQACDRYLGALNFQRLSQPIDKYMKSYSKHPFGPTDFQQMFDWNTYTMGLYGQMLYAFVSDIQMQMTSPVFNMSTPTGVGFEYMELNELISELVRYQQAAEDRSVRIGGDTGDRNRPVEDHIDKFFKDQNPKQSFADANVAIFSLPDTNFPASSFPSTPIPKAPPLPEQENTFVQPVNPQDNLFTRDPTVREPTSVSQMPDFMQNRNNNSSITSEFETGVRRTQFTTAIQPPEESSTQRMFNMLQGRNSLSRFS